MPRKQKHPKINATNRTEIRSALRQAIDAQTEFWDALFELESALGFEINLDNRDLAELAGGHNPTDEDVDMFIAAARELG